MAVIQKIRERYGKIAGAVIAIALISFIVSDARNGQLGSLFGGGPNTSIMKVNGEKVEGKDFNIRVDEYETLTSIYSNRGPLGEQDKAQIKEQVLQSMAYEQIVEKMCDKLGLIVTEQEKNDIIYGGNAHQLVKQFQIGGQPVFVNKDTKQFDPSYVKGLEQQLKTEGAKIDRDGKVAKMWNTVKNYVIRSIRTDKFNTIMMGSLYYPAYAAKWGAADMNQIASIKYVKVPFSTIPDADVKVTDDDIKAFMNKHKAIYQTEQTTRSIEYVSFDIIPASADTARAKESLEVLRSELAASKDEQTYVGTKTDDQNGSTDAFLNKTTFTSRYADTIMSQPVGSIYGPYLENGSFKLSKIVDKKVLPDSIKARHILIVVKSGSQEVLSDTLAHQRIDSIAAAIKAGASFDSMVAKYSDDQSSKAAGGEVSFTLLQRPQISKTFGDFVFETGKVGESKIVKADNSKTGGYTGYHLIEIKEQKAIGSSVKLATIVKSLVPSDSTDKAIYAKANDFITKSATGAEFDANVKKLGYDKRNGDNLKESSFLITGLGSAREIIKWAYTHKVGDVSDVPFTHDNQRYVVAKVSGEQAKGILPITASNRPMLEQRTREDKKAQMMSAKYKGQSLEAIGTAASSPVMQSDTVILGNGTVSGAGFEPKVAGYAFCKDFPLNTVSSGIKGSGGIYFIMVLNRTTKAEDPASAGNALMMQKRNQEGQLRSYVQQMLTPSIVKTADIKYNISNF